MKEGENYILNWPTFIKPEEKKNNGWNLDKLDNNFVFINFRENLNLNSNPKNEELTLLKIILKHKWKTKKMNYIVIEACILWFYLRFI